MMRVRRLLLVAVLASLLGTPLGRAEWASGGVEVALEGNGTNWLVHATLNGVLRGIFLLDTGATYCVLAPNTASRLRLASTARKVSLQTANGLVSAPIAQLQSVDVGGSRARNVDAVIYSAVSPAVDGIIGLSFLNNFTYAVDPRRRVLRLN
jgi:clan AA aspartic protease (TIGR02281 family)